MMLHKGKQNFWSQLLISMIAIFALPAVQGIEHPDPENYQSQSQQIQQQISQSAYFVKQVSQQFYASLLIPAEMTHLNKIEPLFLANYRPLQAPIRAGPFFA